MPGQVRVAIDGTSLLQTFGFNSIGCLVGNRLLVELEVVLGFTLAADTNTSSMVPSNICGAAPGEGVIDQLKGTTSYPAMGASILIAYIESQVSRGRDALNVDTHSSRKKHSGESGLNYSKRHRGKTSSR